jgi:hypothetical protein
MDPVGPGGPQPGYNLNWAYQQSRYTTEVAASQSDQAAPPAAAPNLIAALYK